MPVAMEVLISELSTVDRALIENVRVAKGHADSALDAYAASVRHALESEALSYGILGHQLGIPKESIWKSVQRYLIRNRGEIADSMMPTQIQIQEAPLSQL